MRVWHRDIPLSALCRQHLLGLHKEIHPLLTFASPTGKGGSYRRHPETLRWTGHLPALRLHHDAVEAEMLRRGYSPQSPVAPCLDGGSSEWPDEIAPLEDQLNNIRGKQCRCDL
jgi:hypothetical protein